MQHSASSTELMAAVSQELLGKVLSFTNNQSLQETPLEEQIALLILRVLCIDIDLNQILYYRICY